MEGIQTPSLRSPRFVAALALSAFALTGVASAQQPMPASQPPAVVQPYTPDPCGTLTGCRTELGLFETMRESLCGDASTECNWRPLTLRNFFSEGWREPWVGGPAGQCGLTPRHGWLGSFEGLFYRLWLVNGTYQNNVNQPQGGNAYRGDVTAFLPLSRRLELFVSFPFVTSNGTLDPTQGYITDIGDLSVAASFLLSESASFTQLFTVGAVLPTGTAETGGNLTSVFPRYSFWSNPTGAWVVRGGAGVNFPLDNSTAEETFSGNFAVGRYFRPHNVPFGDLVFYVNSNVVTPLESDNGPTYVGVGPGTRFQIVGNLYFLSYFEVQVTGEKPYDYQVQAAIVKAW